MHCGVKCRRKGTRLWDKAGSQPPGWHARPYVYRRRREQPQQRVTKVGPRVATALPQLRRPQEEPAPRPGLLVMTRGHKIHQHRQIHAVEAVEKGVHKGLVEALREATAPPIGDKLANAWSGRSGAGPPPWLAPTGTSCRAPHGTMGTPTRRLLRPPVRPRKKGTWRPFVALGHRTVRTSTEPPRGAREAGRPPSRWTPPVAPYGMPCHSRHLQGRQTRRASVPLAATPHGSAAQRLAHAVLDRPCAGASSAPAHPNTTGPSGVGSPGPELCGARGPRPDRLQ